MIIQSITIMWTKEVRGVPFSTLRNQYSRSFPLPDLMVSTTGESRFPFQEINVVQSKNEIKVINNTVNFLELDRSHWKIGCTEIQKFDDYLNVQFKYSDSCGKPKRYDYRFNYLTEQAFELQINEYGRISYNGRLVHPDTGDWIYQFRILNVYNTRTFDNKIFTKTNPLKEYTQLAVLF